LRKGWLRPNRYRLTKKSGNKVEIRVKDNGNGIPDAIKKKIFQPFFTTKPAGQNRVGVKVYMISLKPLAGN